MKKSESFKSLSLERFKITCTKNGYIKKTNNELRKVVQKKKKRSECQLQNQLKQDLNKKE